MRPVVAERQHGWRAQGGQLGQSWQKMERPVDGVHYLFEVTGQYEGMIEGMEPNAYGFRWGFARRMELGMKGKAARSKRIKKSTQPPP